MKTLWAAAAAGAALPLALIAAVTLAPWPASSAVLRPGSVPAAYAPWVIQAGRLCPAVSAPLIAAQITQESGWNPKAFNRSSGAEGMLQFLPATWRQWGADANHDGTASPWDPADAITAGGRYDCALAAAVAHLPGDPVSLLLAAYNAGPASVLRYRGIPPFPETEQYVARVLALTGRFTQLISAPGTSFAAAEIAAAERYTGTPYAWGGGGPNGPTMGFGPDAGVVGFDCSGLVLYAVYRASGGRILLPHSAEMQFGLGTRIPPSQVQPGDLVFFAGSDGTMTAPGHVGIVVGNGMMIEAYASGYPVRIVPYGTSSAPPGDQQPTGFTRPGPGVRA